MAAVKRRRETAAAKRKREWSAHVEKRKREEQERIDAIVAEFAGDAHAMAEVIQCYRRAMALLGEAVELSRTGAPFTVMPPGPHWRPQSPGS